MSLPEQLRGRLRLPVVAAPMFLASGPDLVVETCRAGALGTFPALNQRSTEGYGDWLSEIAARLAEIAAAGGPAPAPFGVNLIAHRTNPRLAADLEMTVRHKVPVVITSLGAVPELVEAVHGYGGLVFHDVISLRHARKAAVAGVDGIIAVCAGAGGHAGRMSPFALSSEIRAFFDGTLLLAGALNTGAHVAAARAMGADLAYMGTRFIATREAMSPPAHKAMILAASASDVLYTDRISGVHANFLRDSILAAGLDPDALPAHEGLDMAADVKAWKTIWSAGEGVGGISDLPGAAALCARIGAEYRAALAGVLADP
ncbi:nitronate monooxygenase (plasmid) [Paroceanicella profunda]|uniref:Nitronate monooxygenase n=1 Tax=Paroceanicella profunda TaxID=2579971 RepID=A0A5B8FJ92_9RHOB|nr:nitronate monooxygenase [Paroceanicella profunda]QDL94651.1 nitronate monooxygenase [Paroceanicella profunda]